MTKVMVSLPEELLAAIDREAADTGRTRSGLLQYALRLYLAGKMAEVPPGRRPEVRAAMERARRILEGRADVPAADSTELIRAARDSRRGSSPPSTGQRRTPAEG
jgi:Arc/MetJ-type ribon-helix-helix transcriptional regulator